MSRQHTEVALAARDLDLVDLLADEAPVRGDDLEVDVRWKRHSTGSWAFCYWFIFRAFSTASSIVPTM